VQLFQRYGLAAALTALLALGLSGCGGQSNGNQAPKITYSSVLSFGDSLSDAGTYKVGSIAAAGGGLFTVNGITGLPGEDPVPSYTWAQLVSAATVGQVSCAARTGGFGTPTASMAVCTNYAQGGSRVSNPMGTRNNGFTTVSGASVGIGALTEPIVTQVANYLATMDTGRFKGSELITVQGGSNDLFAQAEILTKAATAQGSSVAASTFNTTLVGLLAQGTPNPATAGQAIGLAMATEAARVGSDANSIIREAISAAVRAGNTSVATPAGSGPVIAAAQSAATIAGKTAASQYAATTGAGIALSGMVTAATELSDLVKYMVSKGAKHIVVTNLPDVSQTPYALDTIAVTGGVTDNSTQQLALAMTNAFNNKLQADLAGIGNVLFVDVFTENQKQINNPSQFSLTNVRNVACSSTDANNPTGSALLCKPSNLIAGDTSRFLFADNVHPTPYGHKLLAQLIVKELVLAGWL
jgi:outer membrane lipase/esterase